MASKESPCRRTASLQCSSYSKQRVILLLLQRCSFPGPSKPMVKISDKPTTVEAQDRSPITLTIGDNVTALTNTSITIQCPTSGVPTPTITWTKDGQEIPSGGRYKVQDNGSLVISGTYEEVGARYTCTANNVAGKDSASSTVQVLGK